MNKVVTLKRLKQYAKEGWKVKVSIIDGYFASLEAINPIWLKDRWYGIVSVDRKNKTIYAILMDNNEADDI